MKKIFRIVIFLVASLAGFFLIRLIMPRKAGKLSKKIDLCWEKILFAFEEGIRESKLRESEFKRRLKTSRAPE